MSRGPDVTTLLTRALVADAATAGLAITVDRAAARRWASATFTGARVRLILSGAADATAWVAALPEADLPVRGHLVAEVAVLEVARDGDTLTATVEALTVEDR